MRQSASAWQMQNKRNAFTLIEVMAAVAILSVAIAALLKMQADNTYLFSNTKNKITINQYASFVATNPQYGFTNNTVTLKQIANSYPVNNTLFQKLNTKKLKIIYKQIRKIDFSDLDDKNTTVPSNLVLYIGKTIIKTDKASTSFYQITTKDIQ